MLDFKLKSLLLILLILLIIPFAYANENNTSIFVSKTGNDLNNASFNHLVLTVERAISIANSQENSSVIYIDDGNYKASGISLNKI